MPADWYRNALVVLVWASSEGRIGVGTSRATGDDQTKVSRETLNMKSRIHQWAGATCAVAMLALGAGCASTGDLDALRAELESLKNTAAAAGQAASSAMEGAETARAEAGDASRAANNALSAAREAQTTGTANSERIERMFKKSMMK